MDRTFFIVLFLLPYGIHTLYPVIVPTTNGNGGGANCDFPFLYQNVSFSTCINENKTVHEAWCAVTTDFELDGLWGYCNREVITNNNEEKCIFPFTYNGKVHTSCTTEDADRAWCQTISGWGYCSEEGGTGGKPLGRDKCIFPFEYNNELYYTCITTQTRPWCNTESDASHWGFCDSAAVGRTAYGNPLGQASNLSDFGPQLAVDNNYRPYLYECFVSEWVWDTDFDGPWWAVDLGRAYMIDGVRIVNIGPDPPYDSYLWLEEFYIDIGWYFSTGATYTRDGYTNCLTQVTNLPEGDWAETTVPLLMCNEPGIKGRYLTIHQYASTARWKKLFLCEVQLLGTYFGDIVGNYNPPPNYSAHLSADPELALLSSSKTVVFYGNDMTFTRHGQIAGWVFYCARSGTINFQIWRPSGTNLQLQNSFTYTVPLSSPDINSYVYVNTSDEDMNFAPGYLIGVSYPLTPPVKFYAMNCQYFDHNQTSQTVQPLKYSSVTTHTIGEIDPTFTDTTGCVDHMVEAIVNYFYCRSLPCLNGGTCIEKPNSEPFGYFECNCLSGYTGYYCEFNIDECSSNPCQNNGRCFDRIAGYTCLCLETYTGIYCETEMMTTTHPSMVSTSSVGTSINLQTTSSQGSEEVLDASEPGPGVFTQSSVSNVASSPTSHLTESLSATTTGDAEQNLVSNHLGSTTIHLTENLSDPTTKHSTGLNPTFSDEPALNSSMPAMTTVAPAMSSDTFVMTGDLSTMPVSDATNDNLQMATGVIATTSDTFDRTYDTTGENSGTSSPSSVSLATENQTKAIDGSPVSSTGSTVVDTSSASSSYISPQYLIFVTPEGGTSRDILSETRSTAAAYSNVTIHLVNSSKSWNLRAPPYPHHLLYKHEPSKWEDPDKRISAIVIGIMELIFVCCEVGLILVMDIHTCYKHKKRFQRLEQRRHRRISPTPQNDISFERF